MKNTLFSLRNISVREGLAYPDTDIHARRLTVVTGRSGCGKSTMLALLNGTLEPEQGKVYYKGKDIREIPPLELRHEIILVPQKIWLFPSSIEENFREFYRLLERPRPNVQEIRSMLEKLGIDKDLDTSCTELSGGERHRVYLAVCLSLKPEVLLLDEPTAALDHENARKLAKLLQQYSEKQSIVMVCHDQSLFAYAGDRIHLEKQQLSAEDFSWT